MKNPMVMRNFPFVPSHFRESTGKYVFHGASQLLQGIGMTWGLVLKVILVESVYQRSKKSRNLFQIIYNYIIYNNLYNLK